MDRDRRWLSPDARDPRLPMAMVLRSCAALPLAFVLTAACGTDGAGTSAGRLWVERTTADGEPREADVFDANGSLVLRASWPRAVRLGLESWVGTEWVAGIARGEFDEPQVVVMRVGHDPDGWQ